MNRTFVYKSHILFVIASAFIGLLFSTLPMPGTTKLAFSEMVKSVKIKKMEEQKNLPFKRIAIFPFESWNEYLSGNTLSDYFIYHLMHNFHDLTIVERQELKRILKEQYFSQTGAINFETANLIGKIIGVDAIMIGKITTLDTIINNKGAITVSFRIIDTNTGEILWSDKQTAKMKPKLIKLFESSYKSPMEVADYLLEQVVCQSVTQLKLHFSQSVQGQTDEDTERQSKITTNNLQLTSR